MVAIKEIYLGTTKVRPQSGRSPSANTIAYYPLTSSSQGNDMKGFGTAYNLTGGSYGTNQGVDCVNYSSSKPTRSTNILGAAPSAFTVSCWAYVTSGDILAFGGDGGNTFTFFKNGNYFYLGGWNYDYATTGSLTTGWHHLLCSYTPGASKAYMDGVLVATASFTYTGLDTSSSKARTEIGRNARNWGSGSGYMSELIVESVAWSASEVTSYYNSTKSNYGL